MTKIEKAAAINQVIQNERNEFARSMGAEAYINDRGQLRYRDRAKGYTRRISFAEILAHLHGEDIRAIRAVV